MALEVSPRLEPAPGARTRASPRPPRPRSRRRTRPPRPTILTSERAGGCTRVEASSLQEPWFVRPWPAADRGGPGGAGGTYVRGGGGGSELDPMFGDSTLRLEPPKNWVYSKCKVRPNLNSHNIYPVVFLLKESEKLPSHHCRIFRPTLARWDRDRIEEKKKISIRERLFNKMII